MANYRQTQNHENLQKAIYEGVGPFGIPELDPTRYEETSFIPFNHAKTEKRPEGKGVHFFIDDYQFLRLWRDPDRYIPMLRRFRFVMTPDFSAYADYPVAVRIWNHYRKHWLGAYMRENGIDVIPTISWSDEDSFAWCFDGEPVGGVVAVSSVGTQKSEKEKELFLKGYVEMTRRLEPETIVFHGGVPEGCAGNVVKIEAFQEKFRKAKSDGR